MLKRTSKAVWRGDGMTGKGTLGHPERCLQSAAIFVSHPVRRRGRQGRDQPRGARSRRRTHLVTRWPSRSC